MKENSLEEAQAFLKQYKMFSKALNFINDQQDKVDIYSEMDKLELKILDLTNILYEEELEKILSSETSFLKEERLKLQRLVDIISSRLDYVNLSLKRHKLSTGNLLTTYKVKGEENLSVYRNNIKVIDKYRENLKNKSDLLNDIKSLELKISSAMDRIESNKKANQQLEKKMINLLNKTFEEFNCNELLERRKEINLAYEELGYSLDKARENVRVAKLGNSSEIIIECDNMLSSITLEYEKYKEKKYILELIDIYDEEVTVYSELLEKREKINDVLKNISNSDIYKEISDELKKQYNTIKLEQQDVDTYNSLCDEKKRKKEIIEQIDKENSSKEFSDILKQFLDNEKKYREALYLEQQQKEYAERQKKLLRDKEIQEERNRRQKLIEEERNKDIEKRTRELLKQKQTGVLESQLVKKNDAPTSRVEKNSNTWSELPDMDNVKREKVGVSNSNISPSLDREIPVIKNDRLSSKIVNEDDVFFSSKEKKELGLSINTDKESSWF